MKFIFKGSGQITLPITPESFQVETARNIQKVNVHEVGDVNLPGNMALGVIKIDCLFPNNNYPFAADYGDPYSYVERFQKLISKKKPVRFIVTESEVNERVLVESISYGEKDGTGDVYATITMVGYREVGVAQTAKVAGASVVAAAKRAVETPPVQQETSYAVKNGDSYMSIARKNYGDHWEVGAKAQKMAKALALYNGDKGFYPTKSSIIIPPYEKMEGWLS